MSGSSGRRAKALSFSLGTLIMAGVAVAAPAQAYTTLYYPDNCGYDQAQYTASNDCEYALAIDYLPSGDGANATLFGDVPNYSSTVVGSYDYDYVFGCWANTNCDGYSQGIRNNAASAYNTSPSMTYTVYYYTSYTGHAQSFGPSSTAWINFDTTLRNADASQCWNC